jgi:hypothetical protein
MDSFVRSLKSARVSGFLCNGSFAIVLVGPRLVALFDAGSQYGHYGRVQYLGGVGTVPIIVGTIVVLDNFSYYCCSL